MDHHFHFILTELFLYYTQGLFASVVTTKARYKRPLAFRWVDATWIRKDSLGYSKIPNRILEHFELNVAQ